jgi:uncharacterized damage-inducible protein DinB
MRNLVLFLSISGLAVAQTAATNPQVASSKAIYDLAKTNVLKSAEKMPDDKFTFKPSPDVRTYGQLLAHVADSQYFFCGMAKGGPMENKGIEKGGKLAKADLVKALTEAFAYCDSAYAGLTDAGSAATVKIMGQDHTKLSALSFNSAHTFEHYGNIVTYLRMNGIVPPSTAR